MTNDEEPKDWKTLDALDDIKLVVADMDGTLLDADSQIPLGFKPMLDRLTQLGVRFVPASGRQYQTLEKMFADAPQRLPIIAENGNVVALDGEVIETHGVSGDIVDKTIAMTERTSDDLGLVICALGGAYVSRDDAPFIAEASKYYTKLTVVPDLREVLRYKDEQILKLAIFDFGDAQAMAERELGFVESPYAATASSPHWVDIMDGNVDKGEGVKALQRALGITRAQTMVFGDYPNDIGMLREGDYSFAMANAHPQVMKVAHYLAPANTEEGVIRVVDRLVR
ncbi:HAD family hydrolase [Bifidobacterium sp. AGR2158]|uniref:HAD family hydrolase n=1 Tax=Bifidobacterium sp. AGR2158 TaxID=1280675 RepID=UPI0003F5F276|nr:HAD family hydrolase [Bifidobacterium sp. AGR2158]